MSVRGLTQLLRRRLEDTGVAMVIPLAAVLLASPPARPPGLERSEYVARVEPICKAETEAHRSVLRGVEGMVRRGQLKRAAPRVLQAAEALQAAAARVAQVPRPPADAGRLARWLGFARSGNQLMRKLASELARGDRGEVQSLGNQILAETKRANATVVGFEFEYCRVSPARFA